MKFIFAKTLFLLAASLAFMPNRSAEQTAKQQDQPLKVLHLVATTAVKDQAMSSTCWSFATLSFIEAETLREQKLTLDLSEMFVARHAYLQKTKAYWQAKGNLFFTPGGQAQDVMNVINQEGLMPENAYTGRCRGEQTHQQQNLDSTMAKTVKALLVQQNPKFEQTFVPILDKHLGKLPQTFTYEKQNYTAKEFAQKVVRLNPQDYVEITSYTHHPFYEPFVLESPFNWAKHSYYNLPLAEFMACAYAALEGGYSLVWNGDVTEDLFDFGRGLALLQDETKPYTQTERQNTFEDKTSKIDHVMHLVGVAQGAEQQKYYIVKNSWGTQNSAAGFMYLSENYFKVKTVSLLLHRKALPAAVAAKLKL